jgi:hypothetical protein
LRFKVVTGGTIFSLVLLFSLYACLPSGLFLSCCQNILYAFLISMNAACPAHFILLDFKSFVEEHKL